MTARITRLNPRTLPDTTAIGYAQISIAQPGRMAFVSGQVADAEAVEEGFEAQVADVMRKAGAALEALDATPEDIVLARAYVVDLDEVRLGICVAQLNAFCKGATPSLTGVGVAALAGPGLLVEMELQVLLRD
ncbi:RidA family protein [Paracoccus sp. TOH]|uniref:RidA family protein n=1 Tax=Paracoccus sp. TOH TaxID=1263728 RepID=UPI000217487F|nr:RidA family protein [Paracoccus sp. TOH]WJS85881.1 RidA family protein [Paracoccus sp. TOH]